MDFFYGIQPENQNHFLDFFLDFPLRGVSLRAIEACWRLLPDVAVGGFLNTASMGPLDGGSRKAAAAEQRVVG